MATLEYHVEKTNGGWQVRRGDRDVPIATYAKLDAAISAARVLAHLNTSGVFVHESNGGTRRTDHRGRALAPTVHQRIRMRS